jgi:serine protease AprX
MLVGDADGALIEGLRGAGFVVRDLGPVPGEFVGDRRRPPRRGAVLSQASAAPHGVQGTRARMEIFGPILPGWRRALEEIGIELTERLEGNTYAVSSESRRWADAAALPFVRSLTRYEAPAPDEMLPPIPASGDEKADPNRSRTLRRGRGAARRPMRLQGGTQEVDDEVKAYDVWLHDSNDAPAMVYRLESLGVRVVGHGGRRIRISVPSPAVLQQVRRTACVAHLMPYRPPRLQNDRAARLMCAGEALPPVHSTRLTGKGQVVAVADSGVDQDHPDLRSRISVVRALGRPGDASDPMGHGTHVSGSIIGTGVASGGRIQGIAPEAMLVFQSLEDPKGGLGGLPVSLIDLFSDAYSLGARVHNCSWGAAVNSHYVVDGLEVDEFVASNPDYLIVVAAGNEGTAANSRHAQPGSVDWLSLCSPGTAKNALVVGASRSDRSHGGLAASTYNDVWPLSYPLPGVGNEMVSGEANALAAFSGRGPSIDRRIKPDVIAPGTDILSTRASGAPDTAFWGPGPDPHYAYMGGTSMAAPLVTGCALLVREYLQDHRGHAPSAALVKAVLVNGTDWLTGPDAVADHPGLPNVHQGFGRICLARSLALETPSARLAYVDTWQLATADQPLQWTTDVYRCTVEAASAGELRVCLTYTDAPGRGLQNDLNLIVQPIYPDGSARGSPTVGNADRPFVLAEPDSDNNVEVVRITVTDAGLFLVQVTASNLLHPAQPFALVVTGPLISEAVTMTAW